MEKTLQAFNWFRLNPPCFLYFFVLTVIFFEFVLTACTSTGAAVSTPNVFSAVFTPAPSLAVAQNGDESSGNSRITSIPKSERFPFSPSIDAGAPHWFNFIKTPPSSQQVGLDPFTLKGLGIDQSQYFIQANSSEGTGQDISNFFILELAREGWKIVQHKAVNPNGGGQQITFNRAEGKTVQVLVILTATRDELYSNPNLSVLVPLISSGKSLILFIAGADPPPVQPLLPSTVDLPEGVAAQNLSFDFGNGWVSQGQITFPSGKNGPFPTLILVHGSGENDMDQTINEDVAGVSGGSKIFRQIAYFLPLQGFAVLRYNKRGVVGLGPQLSADRKLASTLTHSLLTADAAFVLKASLKNTLVDPKKILMLGFSEGSLNVSNLAGTSLDNSIAGIVLMGIQGYDIQNALRYQILDRTIQYVRNFDTNLDGRLSIDEFRRALQIPLSPLEAAGAGQMLIQDKSNPLMLKFKVEYDKDGDNLLDIEKELTPYLNSVVNSFPLVNLPGYGPLAVHFLEDWEQNGTVAKALPVFRKPILLLNGEADTQTPLQGAMEVDLALAKSAHPDHTLLKYPTLGHTFYPTRQFVQPLGPIQDYVLRDLTDWLKKRFL